MALWVTTYKAKLCQNYHGHMLGDNEILEARKRLGQRLRDIRKECHVPQHELARYFFVDRSHISRLETGKLAITFDELVLFASLFSISIADLVYDIVPELESVSQQKSASSTDVIYPEEVSNTGAERFAYGDALGPRVTEEGEELAGPWIYTHMDTNWDNFQYSWTLGDNGWEVMIG